MSCKNRTGAGHTPFPRDASKFSEGPAAWLGPAECSRAVSVKCPRDTIGIHSGFAVAARAGGVQVKRYSDPLPCQKALPKAVDHLVPPNVGKVSVNTLPRLCQWIYDVPLFRITHAWQACRAINKDIYLWSL